MISTAVTIHFSVCFCVRLLDSLQQSSHLSKNCVNVRIKCSSTLPPASTAHRPSPPPPVTLTKHTLASTQRSIVSSARCTSASSLNRCRLRQIFQAIVGGQRVACEHISNCVHTYVSLQTEEHVVDSVSIAETCFHYHS